MTAERRARRFVLVALVFVAGLSAFLGARWLRHARTARAVRQRLEAVAIPVYPGAKDVKRGVMMKPTAVLFVRYSAPVGYPSKAVVDFYDDRLLPQGWVGTKGLPSSEREWGETTWHDRAGGNEGHVSPPRRRGYALVAAWRNPQQDVTLTLLLEARPSVEHQTVTVNVWPTARVGP